jgi:hypothetical protein
VSMFCPLKQVSARYSPRAVAAEVSFIRALVELHTCAHNHVPAVSAQHAFVCKQPCLVSAAGASEQLSQAHSSSCVC